MDIYMGLYDVVLITNIHNVELLNIQNVVNDTII